jgi:N6-L-threonylcarbamoyladenine synthase
MLILGIETSCDETAASVVSDGKIILSNTVLSQVKLHAHFSGVVPEIASRAHANWIVEVIERALSEAKVQIRDITAVAVTTRPGLIGALLIGLSVAKTIAYAFEIPLIAVDHLQAHLHAAVMDCESLDFPFVGLVASGGHTSIFLCNAPARSELLGATADDAVGESFDKVSKILRLGYPAISEAAQRGNLKAVSFPRTLLSRNSLDFSFSGIKTAVYYYVNGQPGKKSSRENSHIRRASIEDICASFQEAVVDVLVEKVLRASRMTGTSRIAVTGGVAANKRLRERLSEAASAENKKVFFPSPELCTDNAAMVAGLAYEQFLRGEITDLKEEARPQPDYARPCAPARRKRQWAG